MAISVGGDHHAKTSPNIVENHGKSIRISKDSGKSIFESPNIVENPQEWKLKLPLRFYWSSISDWIMLGILLDASGAHDFRDAGSTPLPVWMNMAMPPFSDSKNIPNKWHTSTLPCHYPCVSTRYHIPVGNAKLPAFEKCWLDLNSEYKVKITCNVSVIWL